MLMKQRSLKTTFAKMEMKVSVPFATQRQAEIAYNSLRVEIEPSRSEVTRMMTVEGANLVASLTACVVRNLRVLVNSFFLNRYIYCRT